MMESKRRMKKWNKQINKTSNKLKKIWKWKLNQSRKREGESRKTRR